MVVDVDKKGRLVVASVNGRTAKTIILDKQLDRQIDERKCHIDKSDVYETKYINDVKTLIQYDKDKIKANIKKKITAAYWVAVGGVIPVHR